MLIVIGIAVVFIAGIFLWEKYHISGKNEAVKKTPIETKSGLEMGKVETKNLINNPGSLAKTVGVGSSTLLVITPGTSPVSVKTGEVVTKTGEVAKNSGHQGMPNSVTDSLPVDPSKLSENTIKLTINSKNIAPGEFTVHPGQVVSLAMTNAAAWSEVIIFADRSLSAIVFSLRPSITKTITFNAPTRLGEYFFYSDVPAERSGGIEGKMIVE